MKELKAMREHGVWIANEGVLQAKEIASGIGIWLMCLRKIKRPVWLENERGREWLVGKANQM